MKKLIVTAALGVAMSTSVLAEESSVISGLGVGANVGALSGLGIEVNYPINEYVQVRAGTSTGLGYSDDLSDTDVTYQAEVDGSFHRLALDVHPFGGTFFLSAGYALNNFAMSVSADGTASERVGGQTISSDFTLNGELAWDDGATLTLGWGHSPASGWGASLELGAIMTGAAVATLSGTTSDPQYQQELDNALAQEERDLQEEVKDLEILPIVQAGVTYRF